RQRERGERGQCGDDDAPPAPREVVVQVVRDRLELFDQPHGQTQQLDALGGERDAARRSIEQAHVEHELELADRRAEGRLRQVHALGRLAEAARLGHCTKDLELPDAQVHNVNRSIHQTNRFANSLAARASSGRVASQGRTFREWPRGVRGEIPRGGPLPGNDRVFVGCGAGFSGDRIDAPLPVVRTLIRSGAPAAIMFETLGERTLALAQLARLENPDRGYEPLLERMLEPVLEPCLRHRIPILGNFGAASPPAAAQAILALAHRLGCRRPRVAIVVGDDLVASGRVPSLEYEPGHARSGGRILSANAYLGAQPLVEALEGGADVVVTGRVADPSLALAPFAHFLGWSLDDRMRVAAGTLAGHLLECGAQVSGGYYADPGRKDVP